jgi:N-acylneuraminate cytidylyltransferase
MVKIAFIPAKGKSERIPGKNFKNLKGFPLWEYTAQAAKDSGIFDKIFLVTNFVTNPKIIFHIYGVGIISEPEYLTTRPDIEWLQYCRKFIDQMDFFAILRPTSPFRTGETIKRAWAIYSRAWLNNEYCFTSIRAVEPVRQHPGKMWLIKGNRLHENLSKAPHMNPLVKQKDRVLATYNAPTQSLPEVYVQNASLEIGQVENLYNGSVSGDKILPFFTQGYEGFDINYPEDWILAEALIERGLAKLPEIK